MVLSLREKYYITYIPESNPSIPTLEKLRKRYPQEFLLRFPVNGSIDAIVISKNPISSGSIDYILVDKEGVVLNYRGNLAFMRFGTKINKEIILKAIGEYFRNYYLFNRNDNYVLLVRYVWNDTLGRFSDTLYKLVNNKVEYFYTNIVMNRRFIKEDLKIISSIRTYAHI